MSRMFVPVVVILALSSLAGCASSARQPTVPLSVAAQVPVDRVAEAPPSDFEMDFTPPETSSAKRFTKDQELTGSLHPAMASHVSEQ